MSSRHFDLVFFRNDSVGFSSAEMPRCSRWRLDFEFVASIPPPGVVAGVFFDTRNEAKTCGKNGDRMMDIDGYTWI